MPKRVAGAAAVPDPYGWRAGAVRVVANALLVLLAFGVVLVVFGVAHVIATREPLPETPVDGMPLVVAAAVFILARWILVLPVLLPVLIGLEYVNRRASHARVLTTVVALAPMALWQLTQASHETWGDTAILGMTGVLFAVLARLPAGFQRRSGDDRGAPQPPAAIVVVVVAVLAVVATVGCTGRFGAATGSAAATAATTDASAAAASVPTPASTARATPAELHSVFWYSLTSTLDGQGSLKGYALSSGQLGGKTNPPLTLPALAWANGPRAGRVLVGSDDGRQSTVQIVDGGGATIVWQTARLVWRGILMPDGSVILTLLDRATRRDGGVVRLVPRAAPVEIVKPALEPGFGKAWSGELFADARGKVLARQECAPGACRTRFYSVERGFALIASREGKFCELVGLTDTQFVALGQEACESQRPRDVVVGSISTGSTKKVGRGDTAALYVAAGTPHLAIGGTTATGYAVNAISLDGAASVAVPVNDGATLVAQPEANASNYSLPDGWIAFAPDGRVGPDGLGATFVNPESGATVDSRLVVP